MVWDNCFISMVPSFIRYAKCLNCKNQSKETAVVLKNQPFEFRIGDMSCHLRCQRCGRTSRHSIHDGADPNPENIKIVLRDPKSIAIEPSPERGIY